MDYERRGGVLDESAIKVVENTLFSQVVDGSGEVAAAHFDRVETGVEGRVAADTPLLIRPEAYEAQLTGRRSVWMSEAVSKMPERQPSMSEQKNSRLKLRRSHKGNRKSKLWYCRRSKNR